MRTKKIFIVLLLAALAAFAFGTGQDEIKTSELIVFNAASTTDLVNDLGAAYLEQTGVAIKSNPASSGTLAKQLEQGAEADIFISASKKWMTYVEDLGLPEKSADFVQNRLVLIAPESSELEFFNIGPETNFPALFSGRISIGDPAHVPAGQYAAESLEYYGWFDDIEERIQPAADVRAALMVVELGETELGIVYETDAMKSDKVKIVARFPAESHTPIIYYLALMRDPPPEAQALYDFMLTSPDAAAIYAKYGFSVFE